MNVNRLTAQLTCFREQGRKSLIPYLTAGYPDLATTVALIERFDAASCPAIEVGIPFSDSIADGPVIQDSFYRSLDGGFSVAELFDAIRGCRDRVSAALLAMVSTTIVRRRGIDAFARAAAECGFDGLIVPDVPVDECDDLSACAAVHGLCSVLMVAPTSGEARRRAIAEKSSGFVYLIAAKGITGERHQLASDLADHVSSMRTLTQTPLMVGFGISTPEQVREVCDVADGAIVGSALVRRITACMDAQLAGAAIVDAVGSDVDRLSAGTR